MGVRQRATALGAALVTTAVLVGACGAGEPDPPSGTPSGAPSATPSGTPSPSGGAAPTDVATGLVVPWSVTFLPDGTALVSERRSARILRIPASSDGASSEQPTTVADLSAQVRAVGEGGLLGIAASPAYATDRTVFVYLTTSVDNRVVSLRLDDDGTPRDAAVPVLTGIPAGTNHDGGRIAFGPDGMLYVATGDAGQPATAQDVGSLAGKILRIRPDGTVPDGNPVPGLPVWSWGHRNVQGLAWDDTGRLWATEFGANSFDEVNLVRPGRNYGWPAREGFGTGPLPAVRAEGAAFVDPVHVWSTDEASPSGAVAVGGTLYVAALRGERLWALELPPAGADPATRAGEARPLLDDAYGRLRDVVAAPDGALWVSTSNRDGRGDVRGGDDRLVRIPLTVLDAPSR